MVGMITQAQNTTSPLSETKSYDPSQIQVDEDKDLVSGQINKLLREDSPILQQARTYAKQAQNKTGTLNTSMTDGAIFGAMMDRATPIAASDAGTYYDSNKTNVGAQNNAYEFGANAYNQAGSQLKAGDQALEQIQARGAVETGLQANQQEFQGEQAGMDRALQTALQGDDQSWRSGENLADRALQKMLQGEVLSQQEKQAVLDRQHQLGLQKDQQGFVETQADLDRTQQTEILDKELEWKSGETATLLENQNREAELDRVLKIGLQDDMQSYNAAQAELDRQLKLTALDVNQQNILLENQDAAVNAVLSDPELTDEAKAQAILNIQNGLISTVSLIDSINTTGADPDGVASATMTTMLDQNKELFKAGEYNPEAQRVMASIVKIGRDAGLSFEGVMDVVAAEYPELNREGINNILEPVWTGEGWAAAPEPTPAAAPQPTPIQPQASGLIDRIVGAFNAGTLTAENGAASLKQVQDQNGLTDEQMASEIGISVDQWRQATQ